MDLANKVAIVTGGSNGIGKEIADVVISQLKMDERGFVPEVTVWATNPW